MEERAMTEKPEQFATKNARLISRAERLLAVCGGESEWYPLTGGRSYEVLDLADELLSALKSAESEKLEPTRDQIIEECARIAGAKAAEYDDVKGAHYRHSPALFDPGAFGLNMEVVKWSRDAALRIRALTHVAPPTKPETSALSAEVERSPFALPVKAVNVSLQSSYNFGWCAVDANDRVLAPYLSEAQAHAMAVALNSALSATVRSSSTTKADK